MLSLANVFSEKEFLDFHDRILKRLVNIDDFEYFCEPKMDGAAVSLIYKDGILQRAVTRGDGRVGEDISQNVKTIRSIPQKLSSSKANVPSLLTLNLFTHLVTFLLSLIIWSLHTNVSRLQDLKKP